MNRRDFPSTHLMIPNLAPMVDVVMVILVFFMLGAGFAESEGWFTARLPAQLGPGGTASVAIVPAIEIDLVQAAAGPSTILVMNQAIEPHTFDGLSAYLIEKRRAGVDASAPTVITADPVVPYQDVISAMDACIRAGYTNVQIAVFDSTSPAPSTEGGQP